MKTIMMAGMLVALGLGEARAQSKNQYGYTWDDWADCMDFGEVNEDCGWEPTRPPKPAPQPAPAPPPPPEPTPAEKKTKEIGESYGKKDWDAVIRLGAEGVALDPKSCLAFHYRGWAHYFKGEYAKAAEDHIKTVDLCSKTDAYYSFSVALCKSLQGRQKESLEWSGRALGVSASHSLALTQMGYSYFDMGEDGLAASKFEAAIAAEAKRADAHLGLALVRARQGKAADAKKHLADAKALASDLYKIDIWMGGTRRFTAKQKKAIAALTAPAKAPPPSR